MIIPALMMLWVAPSLALSSFENVVFQLQNEVMVTRAKWLVSFHIDLRQYDVALGNLRGNLEELRLKTEGADFKNGMKIDTPYQAAFITIKEQIEGLRQDRERMLGRYQGFGSIGNRERRSVIPFVGTALSYLFGVTSAADIEVVRRAMQHLQETQKGVVHLVEDSVSMINITREEVSQNKTEKIV